MKRSQSWKQSAGDDSQNPSDDRQNTSKSPGLLRRLTGGLKSLTSPEEERTIGTYKQILSEASKKAEEAYEIKYGSTKFSRRLKRDPWVEERTQELIEPQIRAALATLRSNSSKLKFKVFSEKSSSWENYLTNGSRYSSHFDHDIVNHHLWHPDEDVFRTWDESTNPSVSSAARLVRAWQFPVDHGRADRILAEAAARADRERAQAGISANAPSIEVSLESGSDPSIQPRGRVRQSRAIEERFSQRGPSTQVLTRDFATTGFRLDTIDDETRFTQLLDGFEQLTEDPRAFCKAREICGKYHSGEVTTQEGMSQMERLMSSL